MKRIFLPAMILMHLSLRALTSSDFGTISFANVKAFGFKLSFSSMVSDADGFVCLRSQQSIDQDFIDLHFGPSMQSLPGRGGPVGHAKVLHNAAPSFFNVREVVAATDYFFAIIPYRINGANVAFAADSSLFAQVKSAVGDYGGYYSGLNLNSPDILPDLTTLLRAHTLVDYGDFKNTMVANIFERDTISQQRVINCEYSGETKIYNGSFDFVALDYSREHILARSWMHTGGATTSPEGADYHNLALSNLGDVNSLRSNYPFGNVQSVSASFLECKFGTDSLQNPVFEPRTAKKGDVARAIFYQLVCYNGLGGNWGFNHLPSFGSEQSISLLLDWHFTDLPDAFEIAKHEYVYSIQNNRNPFIDFPELAGCVDFSELVKKATCPNVGIALNGDVGIKLYPNPAYESLYLESETPGTIKTIIIRDINGKVLRIIRSDYGAKVTTVKLEGLPDQNLIISLIYQHGVVNRKLLRFASLP